MAVDALRLARRRLATPTGKDALLTVGAGGFAQVILVVSGVIVTRLLSVDDRGHFALLTLIPSLVVQVGAIGLPLALTYQIAKMPSAAGSLTARLRPAILAQLAILSAVHGGILVLLLAGQEAPMVHAGLLTIALVPSQLLKQYALAVMRGLGDSVGFNFYRLLPNALYALGLVPWFLVSERRLVVITLVLVAAFNLATLGAILRARRDIAAQLGATQTDVAISSMIGFGLRGFLGAVVPLEGFKIDQIIVAAYLTPAALAVYVVAQSFTNLPRFVAQSVGMVAFPRVAAVTEARLARPLVWRFLLLAAVVCTPLTIILILLAGWMVPFFFGDRYEVAVDVSRILLAGTLLLSLRRTLSDGARGAGYPGLGTLSEIVAWLFLLPAAMLLAPIWGVEGVAVAFGLSGGVALVFLIALFAFRARSEPVDQGSPSVSLPAGAPVP